MNPEQHQDYSFINQSNNSKRFSFGSPNSTKQRVVLVGATAAIVLILVIVAMIVVNIFSVDNTKKLTDLAAYQNEASRVMRLGAESANDSKLRIYAQTASSTFASHANKTVAIASKKGIKVTDKQLQSLQKETIDKQLESAKIANKYDEVFTKVYQDIIGAYTNKLRTLRLEEGDKVISNALVEYINAATILNTESSQSK